MLELPCHPRSTTPCQRLSWRRLLHISAALCALGAATLAYGGCSSCDRGPRVPFKLGTRDAALADPQDTPRGADAGASSAAAYTLTPSEDEPRIDGQQLPLPFVRAVLAHDLDGDGDRDGVALAHDALRRMRLVVSMREPAGFGAARDVGSFVPPGDASCTLDAAQFQPLSATKAALQIGLRCGDEQTPMPPSVTLFTLEPAPRIYQRLELRPAPEAPQLSLALESIDADEDGHDDVAVTLSLAGLGEDALRPRLIWLDRPSGLLRDPQQPEASLAAEAEAAQDLLAKHPEQAQARAAAVMAYHRALCRESGAAQLVVSGQVGIDCAGSKAAAHALSVLVIAQARRGDTQAAFASFRALSEPGLDAPARLLKRASRALAALPSARGVHLRKGPAVEAAPAPDVRLPSARFVDEGTLYLRRATPVLFSLRDDDETAITVPSDDLMRDPSGSLAVTDIERGCDGYVLHIERAPKVGFPFVAGGVVAKPLLAPIASSTECSSVPAHQREDDGGYHVLGWAPQGVVAQRGSEVRVVPLSLNGEPTSEPFSLAPDAPLPAPLPAGRATPNGSYYAELTPAGPLVFGPNKADAELWRPDGYAAIAARASEVAISPSGRKLAVVAEGTVYLLEKP